MWAKLSQVRVVSTKRLSRKMDSVDEVTLHALKEIWVRSL